MEHASRMDVLIGHLEHMNSIIKAETDLDAEIEEPPGRARRSKSGKSGKTDKSGVADMFTRAARSAFRRIHDCAGILGIINPSDGKPQQEHCPDWAWFRPISFNRQSWIDAWPELQV